LSTTVHRLSTGRRTFHSLSEEYNISEQTVQSILSDAGVSLAEIKAQRLKEKRAN